SFVRGALYGVGPDSKYGEMEFSVELHLKVTTSVRTLTLPAEGITTTYKYDPSLDLALHVPEQIFVEPQNYAVQRAFGTWTPTLEQDMAFLQPQSLWTNPNFVSYGRSTGVGTIESERTESYTIRGSIVISCRLV